MGGFCHLHLHSEYSLLEGACRIADIPAAVLAAGQTCAAITDRASMSGCTAFYRACREKGVRPVIGCQLEVSVAEGQSGWCVFLCENAAGYKNLCKLVTKYCLSGQSGRQTPLDSETLKKHKEGLIVLSGGSEGDVFELLNRGDLKKAEKTAELWTEIFGNDHYYIELCNHGLGIERQLLPEMYALAKSCGISVVAANDVKYLKPEDSRVSRALCCIREGKTLSEGAGPDGSEYYLKTEEEMEKIFSGFDGACENTVLIAERCNFDFDFESRYLPAFPLPEGVSASEQLKRQTYDGMDEYLKAGRIPARGYRAEDYRERAEYELSVIEKMGFCDYFLIVADYVGFAKKSGIPVGPGRGSGCGSLVAFFTHITDVDPLKYGLYFERFLNPERISMPDIDIDFDFSRRDEVLAYVKRKYGQDRVCQIITFGTMAAKAALRDSCRLNGIPASETDRIMFLLPKEDQSVAELMKSAKIRKACDEDAETKKIFETALCLEGLPRNISVHAAGVVITDGPADNYLPLTQSSSAVICQYDMDTVASLGLLKFDFLALKYLTLIDRTEKAVMADYPDFNPEKIPLSDKKTFELLRSGKTCGVFQLDSDGITVLIRRIRPDSIDDIIAAIALYRPGPMDSIPVYLQGKNNPASVKYPHPLLEPVLKETRGCIVYQEQVMSIFRILAGYSAGHADVVRRAMSKKKAEVLEAEREAFVSGASSHSMTEKDASALFDSMTSFAGYAFNKSHAVAYAMISYRTAYLKANFPGYFITELMNISGGPMRNPKYAEEAAYFGAPILPPDINRSSADFKMTKEGIRFGLSYVKGSGPMFAMAVQSLAEEAPFTSVGDFVKRMPPQAFNRRAAEACILCGAFDFLNISRAGLLALLDLEINAKADSFRSGVAGQMDIFSGTDSENEAIPERIFRLPDFPDDEKSRTEYSLCGVSFTDKKNLTTKDGSHYVRSINQTGYVKNASYRTDVSADVERPVRGSAGSAENDATVSGQGANRSGKAPVIFIRVPSKQSKVYGKCANLAEIFDGSCSLVFYYEDTSVYEKYPRGVFRTERVLEFFRQEAGITAVVSKY